MVKIYDTVKYKRSSDSNDAKDADVKLVYNSTVPMFYMNSTLRDVRAIDNNELKEVNLNSKIYDPEYEDENNEERFVVLGAYKNFNGDMTIWLYDKKYSHMFATKFIDTVDPLLVKSKQLTYPIYPVSDIGYKPMRTSNMLTSVEKPLAVIVLSNGNPNTDASSYLLKGDDVTRTAKTVKIEISDYVKVDVPLSVNNFLTISTNSIDTDNTDMYIYMLSQATHLEDTVINVKLTSDVDLVFLPLDI